MFLPPLLHRVCFVVCYSGSACLNVSELERLSGLVGRPSESHPLHNSGLLSLDPVQDKTPLYSQLLQAYKWSNKVTTYLTLVIGRKVLHPCLETVKKNIFNWKNIFMLTQVKKNIYYLLHSNIFTLFIQFVCTELLSHSSILSMSIIWLLIHWKIYSTLYFIFSFLSDDDDVCICQ